MKHLRKPFRILMILSLAFCSSCKAAVKPDEQKEKTADFTTDQIRDESHEEITWDLIQIVDHDAELKHLLEKSIAQAAAQNPDPQTNPVDSLESYYSFIDFCIKALPWDINPSKEHVSLYDRIDQSMGCFYFVCDQPLEELQDKGYYHNSIMYHEPFRSWLIQFTSEWGAFLNTEASWKDEFYQNALSNPDFHLDGDLFEDYKNWKTFNDFFARKLKDPSKRPVYEEGNESAVVSPADSVPQGIWQIDENSRIIMDEIEDDHGIAIKTGTLTDVSVLLKTTKYAKRLHRVHSPIPSWISTITTAITSRSAARLKKFFSSRRMTRRAA